jgi:hypothetical protein
MTWNEEFDDHILLDLDLPAESAATPTENSVLLPLKAQAPL